MKQSVKVLIAVAIVLVIVVVWGVSSYNGLVTGREAVITAQSQIDAMLQRRADLIPNLVASVNSFAAHETEVIDSITAARAALAGATTMEEKAAADAALTSALGSLQIIVENYPELKSDTVYVGLMDELAGSENRISVSRRDYNEAVQNYNNGVIRFPSNVLASLFGFARADYFQAAAGAETVPDVVGMLAS